MKKEEWKKMSFKFSSKLLFVLVKEITRHDDVGWIFGKKKHHPPKTHHQMVARVQKKKKIINTTRTQLEFVSKFRQQFVRVRFK